MKLAHKLLKLYISYLQAFHNQIFEFYKLKDALFRGGGLFAFHRLD